jgi:hypothetical protein
MFSLLPTSFLRSISGGKIILHPVFPTFTLQERYLSQEKSHVAQSVLIGAPDGMAYIDSSHPHHPRIIAKLRNPNFRVGIITKQHLQEELNERAKGIDKKLTKILQITEETRVYAEKILMQMSRENQVF